MTEALEVDEPIVDKDGTRVVRAKVLSKTEVVPLLAAEVLRSDPASASVVALGGLGLGTVL